MRLAHRPSAPFLSSITKIRQNPITVSGRRSLGGDFAAILPSRYSYSVSISADRMSMAIEAGTMLLVVLPLLDLAVLDDCGRFCRTPELTSSLAEQQITFWWCESLTHISGLYHARGRTTADEHPQRHWRIYLGMAMPQPKVGYAQPLISQQATLNLGYGHPGGGLCAAIYPARSRIKRVISELCLSQRWATRSHLCYWEVF